VILRLSRHCHQISIEGEVIAPSPLLLTGRMTYLYLALAIVAEVVATTFLKLSDGFSKPLPSAVTVIGYAIAFYFLSLTLRNLPTGLVYAVWSGVGVVLIATIAWVFQSQRLDAAALCGMGLIVSGVVVINLFSSASTH
jgi:small multidrug resistance pump